MPVFSVDDLDSMSVDELNEVVKDPENPIEVRRVARMRWREIIEAMPREPMDQTILITPDLSLSPKQDN